MERGFSGQDAAEERNFTTEAQRTRSADREIKNLGSRPWQALHKIADFGEICTNRQQTFETPESYEAWNFRCASGEPAAQFSTILILPLHSLRLCGEKYFLSLSLLFLISAEIPLHRG